MSTDPHAGLGGSYEMDANGNRVLRERTGWVPEPTSHEPKRPDNKPAAADAPGKAQRKDE